MRISLRPRTWVIGIIGLGFIVPIFVVTLIRLGGSVTDRPFDSNATNRPESAVVSPEATAATAEAEAANQLQRIAVVMGLDTIGSIRAQLKDPGSAQFGRV